MKVQITFKHYLSLQEHNLRETENLRLPSYKSQDEAKAHNVSLDLWIHKRDFYPISRVHFMPRFRLTLRIHNLEEKRKLRIPLVGIRDQVFGYSKTPGVRS